jgi:cyclophilin family peptidyl-prolyl cis-trans isomerase
MNKARSRYEQGKKQVFEYLEAGCPLGTGGPGYGHIGYWLQPEIRDPKDNPKVRHEEGTVGAVPGEDLATTACKFYITLSKVPPGMDGRYNVFGKVTRGLDVARKILSRPVTQDDPTRPEEPVVIRSVSIQSSGQ